MSGIQSLLKYRFQRKDKMAAVGDVSANGVNGESGSAHSGSAPASPQSTSSHSTVPETPPGKQTPDCASPVIQNGPVSSKRGALVIRSDSESEVSPLKSSFEGSLPSTAASSPWLAKGEGSTVNGTSHSKRPSYQYADSSSCSSSAHGGGDENRELLANIVSLQDLFPTVPRNLIVSALAFNENDMERATDTLIKQGKAHQRSHNQQGRYKRGIARILSDSSEEGAEPLAKRARPLDSYLEEEQSAQNSSQQSSQQNAQQNTSQSTQAEAQAQESGTQVKGGAQGEGGGAQAAEGGPSRALSVPEKLAVLRNEFIGIQWTIIEMTLAAKDNDLDKARTALSACGLGKGSAFTARDTGRAVSKPRARPLIEYDDPDDVSEPPVLEPIRPLVTPQANMGSIKAFQALQKQRSLTRCHDDVTSPTKRVASPSGESPGSAQPDRGERAERRRQRSSGADSDAESLDSDREDSESSDPILHFLNEATLDELTSMNGCSKKKAQVISQQRPFADWEDLVAKIEHSKELTFALISACQDVLRMRGVVDKLMLSCKRISTDMENIVADLTTNISLDEVAKSSIGIREQPAILNDKFQLKPYQMIGLNWLKIMHDRRLNAILGDEMGLGKTIQAIAFLGYLLQEGEKGPHIIIAPSSTLDNWLRELQRWCPKLRVLMYYGSQDDRRGLREQIQKALEGSEDDAFDVIVTTYNMAAGSVEDRVMFKRIAFHYGVFDEGHMLKNMSSQRYQSLMKIRAERRLVLTGTPLQNNLVELMSLLAFVMPDMFSGKTEHVKRTFTMISSRSTYETKSSFEKQTIVHAKEILKPFFLRRLKRDVLQQLPSKTDLVEKVALAEEQEELYASLKQKFSADLKAEGNAKASAGSSMLMELRKAANHALLHRKLYTDCTLRKMATIYCKLPEHPNAVESYVVEDMEVMNDFELHKLCQDNPSLKKFALSTEVILTSGKFRYLDEHLPEMKERGDRVLVFSQFTMLLDILEQYMTARGHRYIRLDGQTPVAERQELIDQYNEDPGIFIFLLSTKAGGLGINLTAANVVIIHDIDFNPYNDKQAEDRCHRVGQTRNVSVYRLVSQHTVEEAMLRCAQVKLQLEQDVTGQGAGDKEQGDDVMTLLQDALQAT